MELPQNFEFSVSGMGMFLGAPEGLGGILFRGSKNTSAKDYCVIFLQISIHFGLMEMHSYLDIHDYWWIGECLINVAK